MALNVTTKALAITLIAVAITRSLISVESLFHVLWQVHAINKKQVTHMIFLTKKLILIPAALMLVMAIAIPAFALNGMAATSAPYEQQVLQARYDMTSANVGFITGVMADAVSLIPQASNLQAPADKLNSDLATLQGYVSSVDNAGFNSYIQNTIIPDTNAAQSAIKDDRQQWKSWNVTAEEKAQMVKDYQAGKTTHDSQVDNARVELGTARLQYYDDVWNNLKARIGRAKDNTE